MARTKIDKSLLDLSGTYTFTGQLIGKGTATNDSAAAGYIGEYVSSYGSLTNFPATTTYGDLTSISLTAGDWDVTAIGNLVDQGATITLAIIGITTTSGNDGTGLVEADNFVNFPARVSSQCYTTIPVYRISLASTTTVYYKYRADYTGGPPKVRGRISARRVR